MFQIDASWAISSEDSTAIPCAKRQEMSRYHLVELALNVPLYHLAVIFRNENELPQKLQLYRFYDLQSAVMSVADEATEFMRLVQETPFTWNKKSELREIFMVLTGFDEDGEEVVVFDSDAGRFRADNGGDDRARTLVQQRTIWQSVAYCASNGRILPV